MFLNFGKKNQYRNFFQKIRITFSSEIDVAATLMTFIHGLIHSSSIYEIH